MTEPADPNTDTPNSATGTLRTGLRRLVPGAFVFVVVLMVLLVRVAVLSVVGLSFDPHGYGMFGGILFTAVLTPVALALWMLYRSMRRRGK